MALPVTPPYVFGNVTSSIPLTNLDADFATIYAAVNGIGNGTVSLANVTITGGSIQNVAFTLDSINNTPIGNVTPSTAVVTSLTDTGLTSGRVTYAGTGGLLQDSANMTFDGSTLTTLNSAYTGTLTGGTGVVNLGSGQFYKDASGNVGIGTASPSFRLDVKGTSGNLTSLQATNATGSTAFSNVVLRLASNASGADTTINFTDATTYNAYIGMGSGALYFATNGTTERMRIDSSGNLLVGTTTTPSGHTNSITAYAGFVCRAGYGGATANIFNINWTGNPYLWIDTTNIGQIATVSDYRLKENVIAQTDSGLDKVMQLQPVQFNRKAVGIFGGSTDIEEGFLAHELQAIIPSAVYGEKDAVTEDGSIQPQSLNWSPVVSVLVKAIQEQQALITDLQTRLTKAGL